MGEKMRLYQDEKKALYRAIEDIEGEVYLFGSRVDNSKKGGDIDILIFSKENSLRLSQKIAARFLAALDSRLDVVVMDKDNISKDQKAFLKTIEMVRLK